MKGAKTFCRRGTAVCWCRFFLCKDVSVAFRWPACPLARLPPTGLYERALVLAFCHRKKPHLQQQRGTPSPRSSLLPVLSTHLFCIGSRCPISNTVGRGHPPGERRSKQSPFPFPFFFFCNCKRTVMAKGENVTVAPPAREIKLDAVSFPLVRHRPFFGSPMNRSCLPPNKALSEGHRN